MNRKWLLLLVVMVFLVIGLQTCRCERAISPQKAHSQTITAEQRLVDRGIWNGPTASIYVSDDSAKLIFSCAEGFISEKLVLDDQNQFKLKGTYTEYNGQPVETTYTGYVNKNQMIFTHDGQTHELIFEGEMGLIRCQ